MAENGSTIIRLLGVNAVGSESGNGTITTGRDLPWLQDTSPPDAWGLWAVTPRDVVILDSQNFEVARYNLTQNDLADASNYQQLKALLKRIAGE